MKDWKKYITFILFELMLFIAGFKYYYPDMLLPEVKPSIFIFISAVLIFALSYLFKTDFKLEEPLDVILLVLFAGFFTVLNLIDPAKEAILSFDTAFYWLLIAVTIYKIFKWISNRDKRHSDN
ncbi:hypothetical protein [Thalassobacillus pellis]|uniref:hypothetical protein n=1 Tax=Thalassobacillus pellis TaxID=748008 RepID=UPI001960F02C|nr:hypothetical protein [Thalassobacillus pellis]MBM7553431.1 hypothetical protein [Thalassobacillus pellis]